MLDWCERTFPRFHIVRSDSGEILGSVTATTFGNEKWVSDGCVGYLMADMKPVSGRCHVQGDFWAFVPDDHCAIQVLRPDTECVVLDGYWGERAELGLDPDRIWQKARYEGDHDHCAVCWETLGPVDRSDGYVSEDATWICCRCYDAFVQQRSLDFIPRPNTQ